MPDMEQIGLSLRSIYWLQLGDIDRSQSEPSDESREAWTRVAVGAYNMLAVR